MNPAPTLASVGRISREAGEFLWRAILCPEEITPTAHAEMMDAAARLSELTSPALADFLLARASARIGEKLVPPQLVSASRLAAKFSRASQLGWAHRIAAAGIEVVYLKGFANAYTLYPDPDLRLFGDLDALVRRAELNRLIAILSADGFTFRPATAKPWGFQAEGSFVPFVSADGACDIDLHVDPDSYPLNRALLGERVFAQARTIDAGGLKLRVPSVEHSLILALSNIAKDRMGPFAVRKIIDLARILQLDVAPNWDEIVDLLRRAGLIRPARAIFALMARLGAEASLPPVLAQPPTWPAAREFERAVDDLLTLFSRPSNWRAALRREFLLSAGPRVAMVLNARRVIGLAHPRQGTPTNLP